MPQFLEKITSTAIWFAAFRCINSCEVSFAFFGWSENWESFFRTGLSAEGVVPKHWRPSVTMCPIAKSGSASNIFWKLRLSMIHQSSNLPWWFPPIPQEGDFQNDRSSDEGERRTSWQPYPKEWKRQSHHLSWLLNLGGDLESWPLPSSLVVPWPEFSCLLCLPFWREGFSYHWPQCSQCTQCPQVHVEFSAL